MNLKLFKPNYKNDRKVEKIDYSFFEEYLGKLKTRQVFRGKFGNKIEPCNNFKKQYAINAIEHQYEMNNIMKRFRKTLSKPHSNNVFTNTNRNFLMTQQLQSSNRSSTQNKQQQNNNINDNNTNINCLLRDKNINNASNKERCLSYNNIFTPHHNIKSNDPLAITEGKMFNMKNNNHHHHRSTKNGIEKHNNDKIDYFFEYDQYRKAYDKNVLFEKLKQKFDFYKKEETYFERNKWKMFRLNENSHLPVKHSHHRIKVMFMRDKSKMTINV